MELDIKKIVKILLSKWMVIVAVSILVSLFGFVYSAVLKAPVYSTTATVWAGVFDESTSEYQNTLTVQNRLPAFAYNTRMPCVLNDVHETLQMASDSGAYDGPVYTVKQLQGMVSTSVVSNSEHFTITVRNGDRRYAQFIANEIAKETCHFHEVDKSQGRFTIVAEATMPEHPDNMPAVASAFICFMLGFVLSCVAVIIVKMFDNRITSESDIKDAVDVTVIAVIPQYDFDSQDSKNVKESGDNK